MEHSPLQHKPVMPQEVIEFLRLEKTYKILDATVGLGGHAKLILEKIAPHGFLIGIDCDESALAIAGDRLKNFDKCLKLAHANFGEIDKTLLELHISRIDGAFFDLGVSSYQLGDAGRGFSFMRDGALDMRMDLSANLRACDIVNRYRKEDLENIIHDFGQERYSRRIAAFIVERRRKSSINSTEELSGLIKKAVGRKYRSQRIHPATRTFQALRIAVNNELDNLDKGIRKAVDLLGPGRRICVISFHSLEDRIVKTKFREFEKSGRGRIVTKKPVMPTKSEINTNPRSRSAKLRVFEIASAPSAPRNDG